MGKDNAYAYLFTGFVFVGGCIVTIVGCLFCETSEPVLSGSCPVNLTCNPPTSRTVLLYVACNDISNISPWCATLNCSRLECAAYNVDCSSNDAPTPQGCQNLTWNIPKKTLCDKNPEAGTACLFGIGFPSVILFLIGAICRCLCK